MKPPGWWIRAKASLHHVRASVWPASTSSQFDRILLIGVLCLVSLGIVASYSASIPLSYKKYTITTYFLQRNLVWVALGLIGMAVMAQLDYRFLHQAVYVLLGLSVLLLVAVLFTRPINNAHRWFRLGALSFQPSELAKFSLVCYLAHFLSRKKEMVRSFWNGFVPPLLICLGFGLLLLKQPDLGTTVILGMVTLTLISLAGTRIHYVFITLLAAAPILYTLMVRTQWRLRRIEAFLDPWLTQETYGYQSTSALHCLTAGGTWGVGLGEGLWKHKLPEAHTDYILAVIGEELGFVGIFLVILVFMCILLRGLRIGQKTKDDFGRYLALGITSMIAFQAAINIGVVLNVVPTKGLTLPFVSFGGSSLVVDLSAIGVLLNISKGTTQTALGSQLHRWRMLLFPGIQNRALPGGGKKVIVETKR